MELVTPSQDYVFGRCDSKDMQFVVLLKDGTVCKGDSNNVQLKPCFWQKHNQYIYIATEKEINDVKKRRCGDTPFNVTNWMKNHFKEVEYNVPINTNSQNKYYSVDNFGFIDEKKYPNENYFYNDCYVYSRDIDGYRQDNLFANYYYELCNDRCNPNENYVVGFAFISKDKHNIFVERLRDGTCRLELNDQVGIVEYPCFLSEDRYFELTARMVEEVENHEMNMSDTFDLEKWLTENAVEMPTMVPILDTENKNYVCDYYILTDTETYGKSIDDIITDTGSFYKNILVIPKDDEDEDEDDGVHEIKLLDNREKKSQKDIISVLDVVVSKTKAKIATFVLSKCGSIYMADENSYDKINLNDISDVITLNTDSYKEIFVKYFNDGTCKFSLSEPSEENIQYEKQTLPNE